MKTLLISIITTLSCLAANLCQAGSSTCASMLGNLFQHVGFSCEMYYQNPNVKLGLEQLDTYKEQRKQLSSERTFSIRSAEKSYVYIDKPAHHEIDRFEHETMKSAHEDEVNTFNRFAGDTAFGLAVHHKRMQLFTEMRNHAFSSTQNFKVGFKLSY